MRKRNHFANLRNNKHHNAYLQQSFNKYGENNFKWEIIKYCKKEELLKLEQALINNFNSTNHECGYNLNIRVDRKFSSEETKRKISEANKGKIISTETRKKIGEANKGRETYWRGKTLPEEMKEKIRKTLTGRKRPLELKEKLRQANLGKKLSEETKRKMSEAHKGKLVGIKLSKEHKEKLSQSCRKFKHLVGEWKELKEQGYSYRKIGKKYNTNYTTVINYLTKYYI